jgi:tRNA A37 threonylcarbamoyladenosine modification protein TsaB
LLYRAVFEEIGPLVEIGTMSHSFPNAVSLVELTVPRMYREDFDSVYDLKPLYLRQSAKRIQWERIRGSRSA